MAYCLLLPPVQTLILLAAVLVLPTVWLRDLSLLSFLSVGGIFASVALLALVGWEGATVTGFTHQHPPFVSWSGVPVTLGLFLFCFSGVPPCVQAPCLCPVHRCSFALSAQTST